MKRGHAWGRRRGHRTCAGCHGHLLGCSQSLRCTGLTRLDVPTALPVRVRFVEGWVEPCSCAGPLIPHCDADQSAVPSKSTGS